MGQDDRLLALALDEMRAERDSALDAALAALARAERAEASRDHARSEMARLGGALELALTDTERERDAALARAERAERMAGAGWTEVDKRTSALRRAEAELADVQVVHVVFQGEGPDLRFVEVETPDGRGISVGEWVRHATYPDWPCLRLRVLPESK